MKYTIFIIVSALLLSPSLMAKDYKILPGSMCKGGNATNTGAIKSQSVVCPLIKDVTSQQSVDYAKIWINIPYGTATCYTQATKSDGKVVSSRPTYISSGPLRGVVLPTVDAGSDDSSYTISCNMSSSSYIQMYKFGE